MTTTAQPTITRLKLPAVRHWVESQQWAIHPDKGASLLEKFERRVNGDPLALRADEVDQALSKFHARANERRPTTKSGGTIAVLPFYGVVAQRMDIMMAYCGGVSTEAFADAFDAAVADTNVSAIVIDCDSPGGSVQGTPELAKRIFDARGKGKKIIAVSNGTMASAAYWICSAADEIVCTPSGEVGSIGVFCVHVDASAMNEMMGLKYTLIKAGEHKAEGNPWEPLPADAEAFIQSQVDEMNDMFVSAVAKQRGTTTKRVNGDFGQGRCLTASQALGVGMIDRVATLEETLKSLGAKDVGLSGRPRAAATPTGMRAAASPTDDDEDDLCPQCGGVLDDDGNCTAEGCDYRATGANNPGGDASASAPAITIESNSNPPAAGAVDAGDRINSPDSPSATAEEPSMDETVKAALEAERKRASDIRALGREHVAHGVTEADIDAAIDGGMSHTEATAHFLSKIRGAHRAAPVIHVGNDRADQDPNNKFKSMGEQLVAIVQAGIGRRVDPRLAIANRNALQMDGSGMQAGTPSGMSEGVGSEGGFFIQNDLLPGVIEPMYNDDPILSRVTRIPIGAGKNGVRYNVVDETSCVDGSRYGGIQMFWADEADTAAAKKPKLRQVEQALKKLIGIAYLTDELLEDAPASEVLLVNAFTAETRFMLTNGIFRGKGGGQMLGFLNTKAVISQAIESTQTIANSSQFIGLNVSKMLANIPASLWDQVIFEYNQELLPYLVTATIGASGAAVPVFIGAGGLANRPFDTILGRPAFVSELCEAPGTPGDIVAVAPSQYHIAEKGGAQMATSVHVRFLNDETALRLTYRVDGKPVWNSTVTPFKGSTARAPFVTLVARS